MQNPPFDPAAATRPFSAWTGLGHWNFYFLGKILLFWAGYLNLDPFYNAVFAAALLVPLGRGWLNRLRHLTAIPFAVALLYYDSWLPPFSRLLAQPEVLNFSPAYLLEILGRFLNWNVIAAGFLAWVAYLFLSQWVRLTTLSIGALTYLVLSPLITLPDWIWTRIDNAPQAQWTVQAATAQAGNAGIANPNGAVPVQPPGQTAPAGKPGNEQLNTALNTFYATERNRTVAFPQQTSTPPFDILFISICSLAWSDLDETRLRNHPLFNNLDVVFDNFNSATSYSGPAVLRLMRAGCGQTPHAELYKTGDDQCYLFENLRKLGFTGESALNHTGEFQGFLDEIRQNGHFPEPFIPKNTRPLLTGFDGSPIWNDLDTLNTWWNNRLNSPDPRKALFYNTITLHDGNREATADGGGKTAPFVTRAQRLLDEMNTFIAELEKSGRHAMVVFIPEHGAALKADKMQIAGMREVPTRDITHVPVGVRLVGTKAPRNAAPTHVTSTSSFLALADLVARVVEQDVFQETRIDWPALVQDLPVTPPVSENEGTVLMEYNGLPYIRVGGRNWIEYPR